jgi:hypothetical protein
MFVRAGAAAAAAGGITAAGAQAASAQPDGSWTGVVTEVHGQTVGVTAADAPHQAAVTLPLASDAEIRVGDVVCVGSITAAGDSPVASPLFFELDGAVSAIAPDAVTIGTTRVGLDGAATARPVASTAAGARSLRRTMRSGDHLRALCITNERDGSRRIAIAYMERLDD